MIVGVFVKFIIYILAGGYQHVIGRFLRGHGMKILGLRSENATLLVHGYLLEYFGVIISK